MALKVTTTVTPGALAALYRSGWSGVSQVAIAGSGWVRSLVRQMGWVVSGPVAGIGGWSGMAGPLEGGSAVGRSCGSELVVGGTRQEVRVRWHAVGLSDARSMRCAARVLIALMSEILGRTPKQTGAGGACMGRRRNCRGP